MRSATYYAKTIPLAVLLFVESFIATKLVLNFVESNNYFVPSASLLWSFGGTFLALLLTNALLIGSWLKWEQYVTVPLPITLGILLVILPVNGTYAVILATLAYVLVGVDVFRATRLKKQLIHFKPKLILRYVSKGILLSFSLITAVLVVITAGKEPKVDLGEAAGNIAEKYLIPKVEQQIEEQTQDNLATSGLNPMELTMLESNPIFQNLTKGALSGFDLKDLVKSQVNNVVAPYKKLVNPIMSVLAFGIVQFVGMLTFPVYMLLVEPLLKTAKKLGLMIVTTKTVEKEELSF